MKIANKHWQTIWYNQDSKNFSVIDQSLLPHKFEIRTISSSKEAFFAIKNMIVRGAPLIGVTGAYGFVLGIKEDPSNENLNQTFKYLNSARPTAVNLNWALKRVFNQIISEEPHDRFQKALLVAREIEEEDKEMCSKIGDHGKKIIQNIYETNNLQSNNLPINILTHCNAGWLATVDWGTALAPIYKAHREGINLHIWVDETRPRNQGASLTSYELKGEQIPHTIITDNAGGYLMQNGQVDLIIVGSDRTTSRGDVCNKIGTYLKALAAKDNNIPFYAALPISTIDWNISNGLNEIPIEARSPEEISFISGKNHIGEIQRVQITPDDTKCFNPSFDVTPSNLVTGLITEKGICKANLNSLKEMYK